LNIYGTASYSLDENIFTYIDLQYRRINYLIDGSDDNLTNISNITFGTFLTPSWDSIIPGKENKINT
jgi:hypothetical protein